MYIYKITNKVNGKIYIGKCKFPINETITYYGSGKIIELAIKKYGKENFNKEIIERCENEEDLNLKEKYWIKFYKSTNNNIGYNIGFGGNGGDIFANHPNKAEIREKCRKAAKRRKYFPISRETRIKMSKVHKGISWGKHTEETKKKMSILKMGIEFSKKHKKNLSIARKKRIITKETRLKQSISDKGKINIKKYKLIDPEGNEHITNNGLTLFCEEHNLQHSCLFKVLKGERKHHKGWRIKRYDN